MGDDTFLAVIVTLALVLAVGGIIGVSYNVGQENQSKDMRTCMIEFNDFDKCWKLNMSVPFEAQKGRER